MRRYLPLLTAAIACSTGCRDQAADRSPLAQRAYVWQREWTPAVTDAVASIPAQLSGVVVLGAEFEWSGKTVHAIESKIDWPALRCCKRCGVAIRVSRLGQSRSIDDLGVDMIVSEVRELLSRAQDEGVGLSELQLDFDCPATQIAVYSRWLARLRSLIRPLRLVITTLPAWLDSPAFANLIRNCDEYVLQVHSVPFNNSAAAWKLCDPILARAWASRAARYKKPFAIALPTYRCIAGFAPTGKLLGVAMDSVQGRWPPDTRLCEIGAEAEDLVALVQLWQKDRPPGLQELLWYRLPIETDARNWRMATFTAVVSGRRPQHHVSAVSEGTNPVDIVIRNEGEADEKLNIRLQVNSDELVLDSDALTGWRVDVGGSGSVFSTNPDEPIQLRPGETRGVGWLRFARPPKLNFELVKS